MVEESRPSNTQTKHVLDGWEKLTESDLPQLDGVCLVDQQKNAHGRKYTIDSQEMITLANTLVDCASYPLWFRPVRVRVSAVIHATTAQTRVAYISPFRI